MWFYATFTVVHCLLLITEQCGSMLHSPWSLVRKMVLGYTTLTIIIWLPSTALTILVLNGPLTFSTSVSPSTLNTVCTKNIHACCIYVVGVLYSSQGIIMMKALQHFFFFFLTSVCGQYLNNKQTTTARQISLRWRKMPESDARNASHI